MPIPEKDPYYGTKALSPQEADRQTRRDQLKAMAEGGTQGLTAYKSAQDRVRTDQQSAVDAALSAASGRNASNETLQALDAIIRPVGDAQVARLAGAGDRFATSQDRLQGALGTFQSQAGRAESLAYDKAYQDALEAAAERAAREAAVQDALTRGEKADRAWGAGQLLAEEALQQGAATNERGFTDELLSSASVAGTQGDPFLAGATLDNLWKAETPEEREAALRASADTAQRISDFERLGPPDTDTDWLSTAARPLAETIQGRGGRNPALEEALAQYLNPAEDVYADNLNYLSALDAGLYDNQYAAQAYADLGYGPYEEALGVFRDNPSAMLGDLRARESLDVYQQTGMLPDEYDAWLEDQQSNQTADIKMTTASALGVSPGIIDNVASDLPVPEALWGNVSPETRGGEIVTQAVALGMQEVVNAIQNAGAFGDEDDAVEAVLESAATNARDNALDEGIDPVYADAIAQIVREQLDTQLDRYGTPSEGE